MTELTLRPDTVPELAPGRSCAGCTTCCKLPAQHELNKPAQTWCEHCEIGVGCRIYETRPEDCRTFYCGWVLDGRIGDAWKPMDSKMVVKFEPMRIVIHVDKDRKDAWRKEPFITQIRTWARDGMTYGGQVLVFAGKDTYRIHPAGEERLAEPPRR